MSLSENEKIWLDEHLDYTRTLPTYNEAFPVFELIYRHFGGTPCFHEVRREIDKAKRLFLYGDGPYCGMPATPNNMPPINESKFRAPKQKNAGKKKLGSKPKTLKYYTHGNKGILRKQGERLKLVFEKWNKWGWIDSETTTDDFDAFFEGEPRHCNMTWKVSTTILTFLLQELLKQPYITKQIKQSPSSMVREQFGLTPNFDASRLVDDDKFKIDVTVYLLDIDNPLPLRSGGDDDDYETTDAALQAVLSGLLRPTKGV